MNFKNADGTWTVIGIVSYDFNPFIQGTESTFLRCRNVPSPPRAFTRVGPYIDWIANVTYSAISSNTSLTTVSTRKGNM